jgi:hypothetical protein
MRVTNVIPLGCPLPLTITTINSVQTLKVSRVRIDKQTDDSKPAVKWLKVSYGARFQTDCGTRGCHWNPRISLGNPLLLPAGTVNCVQTLKADHHHRLDHGQGHGALDLNRISLEDAIDMHDVAGGLKPGYTCDVIKGSDRVHA